MSNPLTVPIAITDPNAVLYIAVDTYAAYLQKATVDPLDGDPLVAQSPKSMPEGSRLAVWTYTPGKTGIFKFDVQVQYNPGSGWQNSAMVAYSSLTTHTLHQTVVFSEDGVDTDRNDCFITFIWFSQTEKTLGQIDSAPD